MENKYTANKYKFIHRFKDDKGIYFILSNNFKKPNPRKAINAPIGNANTQYLKTITRDKLTPDVVRIMDEWVVDKYDEKRSIFYEPVTQKELDEMYRQMSKGYIKFNL